MGEELIMSDFFLRAINGTPNIVCLVAEDGRAMLVNPACERITGYSPDELLGKDFWRILHPGSDYSQVEVLLQLFDQVDVLDYETTLTTKSGEKRIVAWNLIDWADCEAGAHIIGFGMDVTKRNLAEMEREFLLHSLERRNRQFQIAAEVSKSLSTILDTELLIKQTVEQVKEYFGYYYVGLFLVDESRAQAVLRAGSGEAGEKMIAAGYHLAVGDGSMVGWTIANSQPRIALDVGLDAVHFNNPYLPDTRSEVTLPFISRGRCIGALTFQSTEEVDLSSEDVTVLGLMAEQLAVVIDNARLYEQVQRVAVDLEKRVAERTAELTAVNQELEAFAYSVSHDLRAPLRAVDGFSQALLEDYHSSLDETAQDYLQRIRAASRRMGQLISDLLKLSRLTRGEMHRGLVDLSTLAGEVMEEITSAQPERQVEVKIEPGLSVKGDARLLRVALENLLGNAWKFTSKQPDARIEFGSATREEGRVYFVQDNGAGFDRRMRARCLAPSKDCTM